MNQTKLLATHPIRMGRFLGLVILIAGIKTVPLIAQDSNQQDVWVNDPRPVAAAVLLLETRSGQAITYEDPRYVYQDDITDMTDPDYAKQNPDRKALIPKFRTLRVDSQALLAAANFVDPSGPTQAVLDIHAAGGAGGVFRQMQTGETTHVLPSRVKDASGQWVEQNSILDLPITLSQQNISGLQALQAIVQVIGNAANTKVFVGTVPVGLLMQYHCDVIAAGETARAVLLRVLAGTNKKLSWQLFYDPGIQSYALNLHQVALRR